MMSPGSTDINAFGAAIGDLLGFACAQLGFDPGPVAQFWLRVFASVRVLEPDPAFALNALRARAVHARVCGSAFSSGMPRRSENGSFPCTRECLAPVNLSGARPGFIPRVPGPGPGVPRSDSCSLRVHSGAL